MLGMGYKQSQRDHTLFVHHSTTEGVTTLFVTPKIFHIQGNEIIGSQGQNYNFEARVEVQFLKRNPGTSVIY